MKIGLRELVFFAVMLSLLGSTWWFVFKKANERRAALQSDISAKQTALENLRVSTAGIDDTSKKLSELQQAIQFFEGKLPQEKEIDKVVKEIAQIAQANDLVCRSIKTLKATRNPNVSEQPIELIVEGAFPGFYEFLLQLEKLPRITRTTKLEISKIDDRDGATEAKLVLSIFFEPEASRATDTQASSTASVR